MTVELYRDDDEHLAVRLAAGCPLSAIVSDDPVERAARLNAMTVMAASAGIRVYRVGNGLRSPLTLPRIAFQLANRGDAGDAVDPAPMSQPRAKSVLVIEQAETLAADALSAMQDMAGVQLFLVGTSALRPMLAAFGGEPSASGASVEPPASLDARASTRQDDYDYEPIDDPAWALDWDDGPLQEHAASRVALSIGEPSAPVLCAVPRPHADRPRGALGPLWIAAAATVAIVIAATTLVELASVSPPPASRPQIATLNAANAPQAAEQAPVAALPDANQPARSANPQELRQASAAPPPPPSVATVSAADPNRVASSDAASSALAPSDGPPTNVEALPPADAAAKLRRQFEEFLRLPENRARHFAPDEKEALFAQFTTWRAQQANGSIPGQGLGHAARIVLHAPRAAPLDGRGGINQFIDVLGPLGTVQTRTVDEQPTEPSVRYFYREDAAIARQVATALDGAEPGWQPRDFTSYRPKPVAGTIEVWLPRR